MTNNSADEPTPQFDPLADADRDVFELRYDLQQASAEVERLSKLAEANGQQARFWADHFAEVEKANRDALGAHHKSGHSVAELIAALVDELAEVREHLDKVRQGLRTPEGWATKMHALHVRQQRDKARDLLGAIWLHVGWRSVTRHLTTEQRELWADAVEVAGDPGSTIAVDRWWRDDAPMSASDTSMSRQSPQ
jgi:hypothetical protein